MGKNRTRGWPGLIAASVLAVLLAGCGGGDDGAAGPAGAAGPPGAPGATGPAGPPGASGAGLVAVGSNAVTAPSVVATNAAAWQALVPTVTVTGVTIASPPVVNFTVKDAAGKPVVGLGNTSKASTAKFASYPNLAFSLAKLVPGADGIPGKWVSYIVTTVPTTQASSACAPDLGCPTRPSTDNTGTLVDNGDGSYKYTFWRDVTAAKAQVAAMAASAVAAGAANLVADLGDLTYDDNVKKLTHRLTIQFSGNAPGTGTNTPTGADSGIAAVPLKNPFDAIYDFIPAENRAATAAESRVIVSNAKCEECHQKLGGIPGGTEGPGQAADFHGGSRNNVAYCVVCHTDQRKYGRTAATFDLNGAIKVFKPAPNATTISTYVVDGRTVGNLPNFIHKVHLGGMLANQKYNYGGVVLDESHYPQDIRNCTKCHDGSATSTSPTPQGNNWKTVPSILACGSCHDGINFATGTGVKLRDAAKGLTSSTEAHPIGGGADDATCALCHKPSFKDIDLNHLPITPPNLASALHVANGNANTNAAWIASGACSTTTLNTACGPGVTAEDRLPAGAIKVTYEIRPNTATTAGVYRNATKNPVMVFRTKHNGVVTNLNPNTSAEIFDNFMGAPSVYFVFAVPQDGITAPADFNASASVYLKTLWKGTGTGASAGTLTGPDASGWYTATLTGVTIPDSAVMLTGGLGYSYNVTNALPLTQTNVVGFPAEPSPISHSSGNKVGGLIVISPNVQQVATLGAPVTATNPNGVYSGRRAIVDDKRCNACHQELGAFTEEAFHGGQRNDGTTCAWCHTPNRTSSGWSADSTAFVHAIHAKNRRTVEYTWHALSETEGFWQIGYPGILNKCEQCHLPGTYDFSATASAAAADNKQYRTVGTGKYIGVVGGTITTYSGAGCATTATSTPQSATGVRSLSPYVVADASGTTGTNYGVGFSFNAGSSASTTGCKPDGTPYTIAAGGTLPADPTTLATSPTTAVCSACHDSNEAVSHFRINGGSFYAVRGTPTTAGALTTTETCLVCHGPGRIAEINASHSK